MPVQVWATWFPREGKAQTFIQGFSSENLDLSAAGKSPFYFKSNACAIDENSCQGKLNVDGHAITWNLRYRSTFGVTLSNKGWIGFSRTPHSDAIFSGQITLDGRNFSGEPLGFGVQGHNCGYRHRNFWTWTHAYFQRPAGPATTVEALVYEMPFGLLFRKAILWHDGEAHEFRNLQDIDRDRGSFRWNFLGTAKSGIRLEVRIDGSGPGIHRLSYVKTDCSSGFEVTNNSFARAVLRVERSDREAETVETEMGAVLEMVGN